MLNTAKVMESNPVALRLKELEVLERIADKIEHIHVNGGLDSILTEMINGLRSSSGSNNFEDIFKMDRFVGDIDLANIKISLKLKQNVSVFVSHI